MPNRIIKESICTSDSVDQMTWFEECFWQRLIVNCDDYGRFDARISVLKARLFPLKEKLKNKDIETAIAKLALIGCIVLYECAGKPYLFLPSWENHQTIRAKKSKYPSPDEQGSTREIICTQMNTDESECSRNPIQSESNPNTNSADKPLSDFDIAINNFKDHRKKIKKPMTDHAVDLLKKDLQKYAPDDVQKQIELIDRAIMKGWQTVYPDKEQTSDKPKSKHFDYDENGSVIEVWR